MSNPNTTSESTRPAETPAKPRSPLMLIVLLLVMFALGGVLVVDNYVFKPACEEAYTKLEQAAQKHSEKSIDETGREHAYFNKDDVRATIGFAPTKSEIVDGRYLKEKYCWWGALPLSRRYITVVYGDKDGQRFQAHQIENEVSPENLPPKPVPPSELEPGEGEATDPMGMPPGSGDKPDSSDGDKPESTDGDKPESTDGDKPEATDDKPEEKKPDPTDDKPEDKKPDATNDKPADTEEK
jgi:hypothetical protein